MKKYVVLTASCKEDAGVLKYQSRMLLNYPHHIPVYTTDNRYHYATPEFFLSSEEVIFYSEDRLNFYTPAQIDGYKGIILIHNLDANLTTINDILKHLRMCRSRYEIQENRIIIEITDIFSFIYKKDFKPIYNRHINFLERRKIEYLIDDNQIIINFSTDCIECKETMSYNETKRFYVCHNCQNR